MSTNSDCSKRQFFEVFVMVGRMDDDFVNRRKWKFIMQPPLPTNSRHSLFHQPDKLLYHLTRSPDKTDKAVLPLWQYRDALARSWRRNNPFFRNWIFDKFKIHLHLIKQQLANNMQDEQLIPLEKSNYEIKSFLRVTYNLLLITFLSSYKELRFLD